MNQSDRERDSKDEILREQIRKRLMEQSERLQDEVKSLEVREQKIVEAERIRRIVEEERDKYYTNLGYVRVVDEDGTVEWYPRDRAQALEDKIGEEIDDIEGGQRKVRWILTGLIVIVLLTGGILIFFFRPNPGSIRVASNIRGASIIFNNDTTSFLTDSVISEIPIGRHLISVHKAGYRLKGPQWQEVNLHRGENAILYFDLEPAPVEQQKGFPGTRQEPDTLYERLRKNEAERNARMKMNTQIDSVLADTVVKR